MYMQNFQTTSVAQTQVWRSVYHEGFYPHHFPSLQRILPENYANHIQIYGRSQPRPDIPFTAIANGSVPIARRILRLRMEEQPPIWRVDENLAKKNNHGHPTRGGPPAWGVRLTAP